MSASDGVPAPVASLVETAQTSQAALVAADARVTTLNQQMADANSEEAKAKEAARTSLKAATDAFDAWAVTTRQAIVDSIGAAVPPAVTPPLDPGTVATSA